MVALALACSMSGPGLIEPELVAELLRNPLANEVRGDAAARLYNLGEHDLAFRAFPPMLRENPLFARFRADRNVGMMLRHHAIVPDVRHEEVLDLLYFGDEVHLERAIALVDDADRDGRSLWLVQRDWRLSETITRSDPQLLDLALFLSSNRRSELALQVWKRLVSRGYRPQPWVLSSLLMGTRKADEAEQFLSGFEGLLTAESLVQAVTLNGRPWIAPLAARALLSQEPYRLFGYPGTDNARSFLGFVSFLERETTRAILARFSDQIADFLARRGIEHWDNWEEALYLNGQLDTMRNAADSLLDSAATKTASSPAPEVELAGRQVWTAASFYGLLGDSEAVGRARGIADRLSIELPSARALRAKKLLFDGSYEEAIDEFVAGRLQAGEYDFFSAARFALAHSKSEALKRSILRRTVDMMISERYFSKFHDFIYHLHNLRMDGEVRRLLAANDPAKDRAIRAGEAFVFALAAGDRALATRYAYPQWMSADRWLKDVLANWAFARQPSISVLVDFGGVDLLTPGLDATLDVGLFVQALELCNDEASPRLAVTRAMERWHERLRLEDRERAELSLLLGFIELSPQQLSSIETQWYAAQVVRSWRERRSGSQLDASTKL